MLVNYKLHPDEDVDQRSESGHTKLSSKLSFTHYSKDISEYETSERLRRVEYYLYEVAHKAIPHSRESAKDRAERVYHKECIKIKNISDFYKLAIVIRRNHQEWKNYIADPTISVSRSLQPVAENKALAFCFAVLESLGIVNLDIKKPVFIATPVRGKICLEAKLTLQLAKYTLSLWDSLGRPQVSNEDSSFMSRYVRYIFSSQIASEHISYLGSYFFKMHSLMRDEYFLPINALPQEEDEDTIISRYEIDFWKLIDDASLSMAYDTRDSNTLQSISELFPEYPEIIAESIGAYYWFSIAPPPPPTLSSETIMAFVALQEVLREHFLGDKKHLYIKSDCGEGAIHHSVALKHLYKFPRLRKDFKKAPYVLSLLQRKKYDRNPEGL